MESVLRDVSADDLREFIRDVIAAHPDLRNRFLARFGDEGNSIQEYRADIEQLFDQHTQDYPVVTDAIDFSRFFDLAKQYCEHERYQEATIVYRALFGGSTITKSTSTPRTTTTLKPCSLPSTDTSRACSRPIPTKTSSRSTPAC